jgi:hypothetical protein
MQKKAMKLLTKPSDLEKEFGRLIRQYNQYYWATAWASARPALFDALVKRRDRIRRIVVGIHFYQTDPHFIETFLSNRKVRFIKQPQGTFHPKLYLFGNSLDSWEILVGSANFTGQAFTRNTEATVLISSEDVSSKKIFQWAKKLVEQTWQAATPFTADEFENYKATWKKLKPKINSLSGEYGTQKGKAKPIHQVQIVNMSWSEFFDRVRREICHELKKRLRVIEIARQLYRKTKHLNELQEDERKFLAGLPNRLRTEGSQDWGSFGSMRGYGIFNRKITENDRNISIALDQIPLSGQITRHHYDDFIKSWTKSFPGNSIASATRLISMKRPDTFVCFTTRNRSALCKDFEIRESTVDYRTYWEDIVERIFDSNWWLNPYPKNHQEKQVSEARAAFLDSLYYKE